MNRPGRLLPHVLPAFRKLRRAFEKTFRRTKENVSSFKGKDFGLLMKTFRAFSRGNCDVWKRVKEGKKKQEKPSEERAGIMRSIEPHRAVVAGSSCGRCGRIVRPIFRIERPAAEAQENRMIRKFLTDRCRLLLTGGSCRFPPSVSDTGSPV